MRLIVGLILLAASSASFAVDQVVNWVLPTQFADGSAIPAGALRDTRVEWGTCAGDQATGWTFATKEGQLVAPDPATSATVTGLAVSRAYCFRAFATVDTGEESASSNIIRRWYSGPKPKPPAIAF